MQQLYQKALAIKSAIPHPRIMGIIRECGGKMHMAERQWADAATDFFEAFKNYDEAGNQRRIQCLKYGFYLHLLFLISIYFYTYIFSLALSVSLCSVSKHERLRWGFLQMTWLNNPKGWSGSNLLNFFFFYITLKKKIANIGKIKKIHLRQDVHKGTTWSHFLGILYLTSCLIA